jgi:hypothetical protein
MTADTRMAAIAAMQRSLEASGYITERDLAATLLLMADLGRPLLVEGDPGVGKTEIAKALARARGTPLIRLQCFEGLDVHHALYEWNYQRQLLAIRVAETAGQSRVEEDALFSEKYLLKRPLLDALTQAVPPVLLIDEVDRADEAFEAFLLEVLSDYQVSIPEMGTIHATSIPLVVLTSNATRELSPLPVSLSQLSEFREGAGDRAIAASRHRRSARPADRGIRPGAAPTRPQEAAGRGRDAGLGGGYPRPRRRQPRRSRAGSRPRNPLGTSQDA